MKPCPRISAFTLVELLVALAILALLAGLVVPAVSGALNRAKATECFTRMRQLGTAVLLYTQDNQGRFPRSSHSAAANREEGWTTSLEPYLCGKKSDGKFCCPCSASRTPGAHSYGLNVFFELDQKGDSYLGKPSTWHTLQQVPRPARTILFAEAPSASGGMAADHFMSHQWSSLQAVKNAVAHDRHAGKSNFLFVDGHAEPLTAAATFAARDNNLWNPSTCGGRLP